MVNESKYTSVPNGPCGSKVPKVLTTKVTNMPMATGKSMLIFLCFKSSHAVLKKGMQEKNKTGKDKTHEAHRSN